MLNIMRRIAVLCLCAAVTASLSYAAGANDPASFQGYHAVYDLRYAGLHADVTVDLKPAAVPDEYIYSVTTKTRGIARLIRPGPAIETARFVYDASGFRPISYHLDDGVAKAENDSDIQFDWKNGIAKSTHETETVELQISAGMLDRLTADIAAIQELRNGRQLTGYDLVDRNEIRRFEYTLQGEETIKVPAGTFKTVKYLRGRPGSSRATMIWFAPDMQFLPVKLAQLKRGESVVEMFATVLEVGAASPTAAADK